MPKKLHPVIDRTIRGIERVRFRKELTEWIYGAPLDSLNRVAKQKPEIARAIIFFEPDVGGRPSGRKNSPR